MEVIVKAISREQTQRNNMQAIIDLCVNPMTNDDLLNALYISDCTLLLFTKALVNNGFIKKERMDKGFKRVYFLTIKQAVLTDADVKELRKMTTKESTKSATPRRVKKERVVSSRKEGVLTVNMDDPHYANLLAQTRKLERSERKQGRVFVSGNTLSNSDW